MIRGYEACVSISLHICCVVYILLPSGPCTKLFLGNCEDPSHTACHAVFLVWPIECAQYQIAFDVYGTENRVVPVLPQFVARKSIYVYIFMKVLWSIYCFCDSNYPFATTGKDIRKNYS